MRPDCKSNFTRYRKINATHAVLRLRRLSAAQFSYKQERSAYEKIVVGILAHVDAGKTTLSEGLLYSAGMINRIGRVDKRNAYLDTYSLERERGITIFSKPATRSFGETEITLVDTPGHIDFSCEAERALSVQDYAILVVSASDGIVSHTKTLWQLLKKRKIPTFIFVNKTDIAQRTRDEKMSELKTSISPLCVNFCSSDTKYEDSASLDERLMDEFFDTGDIGIWSGISKSRFSRRNSRKRSGIYERNKPH